MRNEKIEQYRKLYNSYLPQYSNKELLKSYNKITSNSITEKTDIRALYNNIIIKNYPIENVIKFSFIKNFCLNKSPNKTTTIFELNALSSRADICSINGKSIVYEIKTEFDTFYRLEHQLLDYKKLFQEIYIVIHESKLSEALKILDTQVGIISYYQNRMSNIKFKKIREASTNKNIDSRSQLLTLTKNQLLKRYKNLYNDNKEIFISNILEATNKKDITSFFNDCMKDKYQKKWRFIHKNQKNIYPLDFQWFFKNTVSTKLVYRW